MTIALSDYRPFYIFRWNLLPWHEIVAIEYNTKHTNEISYDIWFRIDSDWYSTTTVVPIDHIGWAHLHRYDVNYRYNEPALQFTSSGGKGDIHKGLFKYCTNVHVFNSWDEFSLFMDKLSVLVVL